jgi:hypothetical protein
MHYKTIIHALIEQRTALCQQLRTQGKLHSTIDRHAAELKTRHETWKESLSRTNPRSPEQIASEALELAIREIETSLPDDPTSGDDDGFPLDQAMAYIKRHTPPK